MWDAAPTLCGCNPGENGSALLGKKRSQLGFQILVHTTHVGTFYVSGPTPNTILTIFAAPNHAFAQPEMPNILGLTHKLVAKNCLLAGSNGFVRQES